MNDFWKQVTDIFNNRELAIGIWLVTTTLVLLTFSNLRKGLLDVLKALFQPKLIFFFGTIAVAVAIVCFFLAQLSLWTMDQLPPTILWFLLSGCIMAGNALEAQEDEGHFKGLFRNSIKLTGLFEFIVVAHSFSIWAELIFVPFLVLLGALIAVADRNPEHAKAKTLLEWIVFGIVIAFLWNSITQIWKDPSLFLTTTTGLNFLLPVVLTVGCIPVFYALYCYSHIEGARIQIDQKTFQPSELKSYAKKRFFLTFMLRPWLLRRATRQFHILPAKANVDVDQIIHDILHYERTNETRPEIDPLEGWSPYLARDFLKDHGLRTNDYHKGYDEYWASADYIDLDEHILPNKATFYVEGDDGVAKTLKLTGKFMDKFDSKAAMAKLREISETLCLQAIGEVELDFQTLLPDKDIFEETQTTNATTIKTWAQRYPNERGYEVFFTLSR